MIFLFVAKLTYCMLQYVCVQLYYRCSKCKFAFAMTASLLAGPSRRRWSTVLVLTYKSKMMHSINRAPRFLLLGRWLVVCAACHLICDAFQSQVPHRPGLLGPSSNRILKETSVSATSSSKSGNSGTTEQDESLDNRLLEIAKKLKLEIFDLDEGIYGFDSQDQRYGLEVVKTEVVVEQGNGIGLVLMEVAGNDDGRGLVLVREITGAAAQAAPHQIHVGDVVTGAWAGEGKQRVQERTTGLNYDLTVECLNRVKAAAVTTPKSALTLQLNRLVERAAIRVEVDDGTGEIQIVKALAGENLRRLLLRRGIPLYDRQTKRFDMPYATGDCSGDGLCGTCLVAVEKGLQSLNDPDNHEKVITKGRPFSWRAACRTTIGADNRPATLRIATHPQSRFVDELDPGVRHLDSEL